MTSVQSGNSSLKVPLNAIDEVLALSETPSEPWSLHLEARVDRSLDEERLDAAVRSALQKHPLGSSALVEDNERLYWLVDPRPMSEAVSACRAHRSCSSNSIRSEALERGRPLISSHRCEPGWSTRRTETTVMLNVNHAVCDGLSALRLMQSIARAYSGEPDPVFSGDALKEWRLERIRHACCRSRSGRRWPGSAITRGADTRRPYRARRRHGTPRLRRPSAGPSRTDSCQSVFRRAAGASVNDILLAALRRAIGR